MGGAQRVRGDRVAVVSAVHGNLTAFEAVLADSERRGVETVVNLGDTVGKGPRGSACVAAARTRCVVSVQGNWAYLERSPHGLLVNVGSVENPLDEPRASSVLLEPGRDGLDVRFQRVAYDVDAEVDVATRLAMPQLDPWIRELREAHYRGRAE